MPIEYLDEAPPRRSSRIEYLDEAPSSTAPSIFHRLFAPVGAAYENLFTRPGAALRGAIQDVPHGDPLGGFLRGSSSPESVPRFQDQAIDAYYQDVARRNPGHPPSVPQVIGGMVPSAAGFAADLATNPADLLMSLLGVTPQAKRIGGAIAESSLGQATRKFLTKDLSLPQIPFGSKATVKSIQSIRESFLKAPKLASEEFGAGLEEIEALHPDLKVDGSDPFIRLKAASVENPSITKVLTKAASRVGRSTTESGASELLQSVLDDPAKASDLKMKQMATLKRVFQESLQPQFRKFLPEMDDVELELADAYHGIRHVQVSQIPGFEDISNHYGNILGKFRTLKPKFKTGALYKNALGDFGDPEMLDIARELLPHEALDAMQALKVARNVKRAIPYVAAGGLAVGTSKGRHLLHLLGIPVGE